MNAADEAQPLMHRQAMLFVNGNGTRQLHARTRAHVSVAGGGWGLE